MSPPSPLPPSILLDDAHYAAESRMSQILIGSITPSVVATTFVLARLYSRVFLTRSWGIDDVWITLSWIISLAISILNCSYTMYGSGRHQIFQSPKEAMSQAIQAYPSRILYQTVLGTTKIGVCCLYLRIFTDRRSKVIVQVLMAFITLFSLPLVIYSAIHCVPIHKVEPSTCHSNSPDLFVSAVCNILADFLLIVFIIPRIMQLKIALRQKVALLLVVSMSCLVIIAAVIRLLKVIHFNASTDRTWDLADITTWSAVEVNTGLFCASATTIKPLIRKWAPNFFSSTHTATNTDVYRHYQRNTRDPAQHTCDKRQLGDTAFEMKYQLKQASEENRGYRSNTVWRRDDESEVAHIEDSDSIRAMLGESDNRKFMKKADVCSIKGRREYRESGSNREESRSVRQEFV